MPSEEEEPKPVGLERVFFWRLLPRYEARWKVVADQIRARDTATRGEWGPDPSRLRVLDVVAEAIRKEFGWPNANYIPADPIRALLVRKAWDVEFFAVVHDIEKGLKLSRGCIRGLSQRVPLKTGTFAQLVDAIVKIEAGERASRK